jgi:hypothetical protein
MALAAVGRPKRGFSPDVKTEFEPGFGIGLSVVSQLE